MPPHFIGFISLTKDHDAQPPKRMEYRIYQTRTQEIRQVQEGFWNSISIVAARTAWARKGARKGQEKVPGTFSNSSQLATGRDLGKKSIPAGAP
jgi:hypothetical protein